MYLHLTSVLIFNTLLQVWSLNRLVPRASCSTHRENQGNEDHQGPWVYFSFFTLFFFLNKLLKFVWCVLSVPWICPHSLLLLCFILKGFDPTPTPIRIMKGNILPLRCSRIPPRTGKEKQTWKPSRGSMESPSLTPKCSKNGRSFRRKPKTGTTVN